jgi:predicted amidohydrolase YtcJ
MLKKLGIDARTPDLSPGLSVFVRDPSGEPTGWIKEFAAMHALGPLLMPAPAEFRARLTKHLAFLASHGVTTLYDAGNVGLEDAVYGELAALDRAGRLPIRYRTLFRVRVASPTQKPSMRSSGRIRSARCPARACSIRSCSALHCRRQ